MLSMKSLSTFSAGAWWTPAPRNLAAYAAALFAKLRVVAPYALIELILPGGSVIALLLWLYRRQRKVAVFATHEILALL
jgi:hypothetical protein